MPEYKTDLVAGGDLDGFHALLQGHRAQFAFFNYLKDGAGAANDTLLLCRLPPGKVTVMGPMSYIGHTALVGATCDIGHEAYTDRQGNAVALDRDDLVDGESVAAAGSIVLGSAFATSSRCKTYESLDGVTLYATFLAAGMGDADRFDGYIAYIQHG